MIRTIHALTAVLVAGTLAACGTAAGADRPGGPEVTELRYQGNVGTVTPAELAEDLGYLGPIRLRWIGNTISGPQDIQATATGQTDFGGAFNGAVIKLAAARAPVKAVIGYYGSDRDSYIGYYVPQNSPIRGPRDLIGKRIGVNTLGAHLEAVLKEYLRRGGLTAAEIGRVEPVVVPPVNTEQALRQGRIDVAALGGILRDKALERGGLRPLFRDTDLLGPFTAGSVVLREDFIARNPGTTRRFVDAYARAIAWTQTRPREEVVARFKKIIAERGRNEDTTAVGFWKSYGVTARGGVIAEKEFRVWKDWLEREGEITPGQVEVADLYSNEFNPFAGKGTSS